MQVEVKQRRERLSTIAVLESTDHEGWAESHRRGDRPNARPYGLEHLDGPDRKVSVPGPRERRFTGSGGARRFSSLSVFALDVDPLEPLAALRRVSNADIVLCIFEEKAPVYHALQRLRPSLPPLAVMTCWMGQRLLLESARPERLFGPALRSAPFISVFSENQVPIIADRLALPRSRVTPITFGVDVRWYTPGEPGEEEEDLIVAVGSDVGRDWDVLARAAVRLPATRFLFVAPAHRLAGIPDLPNVTRAAGMTHRDYRAWLRRAAVVVVPSQPLAYPTGQSVLLEAYSCGRPTITARTPAMREYLLDGVSTSYEPGEAEDLASHLRTLLADAAHRAAIGKAARTAAVERFDALSMWTQVGEHLDGVLSA